MKQRIIFAIVNYSFGMIFFIVLVNAFWMLTPVKANSFSVTNTNDTGVGSLRTAVADANANPGSDTIEFSPSLSGTITLAFSQLNIADDLTIIGPGSSNLIISGNTANRIFELSVR